MAQFEHLVPPPHSERIVSDDPKLLVPNHPLIPFCSGDGSGPDRWPDLQKIIDGAVKAAYGDKKRLDWFEIKFGQNALPTYATPLPSDSLEALRTYVVGLIAPLHIPTSEQSDFQRQLRDALDLSLCQRPLSGSDHSSVTTSNDTGKNITIAIPDVVLIHDLCAGQEAGIIWPRDSDKAQQLIRFVQEQLREKSLRYPESSALRLTAYSIEANERLLRGVEEIATATAYSEIFFIAQDSQDLFLQQLKSLVGQSPKLGQAQFLKLDQLWPTLLGKNDKKALLIARDDVAAQVFSLLESLLGVQGRNAMAQINVDTGHAIFAPTQPFLTETNDTENDTAEKTAAQDQAMLNAATLMLKHIGWTKAAELLHAKIAGE